MTKIATASAPLDAYFNTLSTILTESSVVVVPAGTYDGFQVEGKIGRDLTVLGAFSASTLTSGSQAGTAGSGTTTTVMQKPTGAANWTSNDLRKKILRVVSGGGASTTAVPTVRPIKSNTTTQLVVDAITGMDETTVFDIVDPAVVVNEDKSTPLGSQTSCLLVENNTANVTFVGMLFSQASKNFHAFCRNNAKVKFVGCHFAAAGLTNSIQSASDYECLVEDSIFSNGAQGSLGDKANFVSVSRVHANAAAGITINRAHSVDVVLDALSCTGNALTVRRANNLSLSLAGNSCAASPLVLENVQQTDMTALTGTGNTGFGVEVSKGGVHSLSGASITGASGDFSIDGLSHASVTWAASASYGSVSRWGTTILISGGSNIRQELDTLRVEGNFDVPASALVSGTGGTLQLGGRVINYGYFHLDQDDAITARAGGGQALATELGFGANVVTVCASGGDSVKLPPGAAVGGNVIHVKNLGAASCNVFPPSGGAINALADNTAIAVAAGAALFFISRNNGSGGLDWVTQ